MSYDITPSTASLADLDDRHLLRYLGLSVSQAMLLFAGAVGLASGFAAFVFYWMINLSIQVFLRAREPFSNLANLAIIVLSPAMGGLVCGLILHYFAPDARGGVSEVIDSLLHRDGYIRARVGFFKALASAICIGSGGSAGREGPVVQIGASVGSSLARVFGVTRRRAQLLVACGAAGGIAAVFNAPIAGAFFAAEIITGRFEMRDLSLLFTASAMGAVVARVLLSNLLIRVPSYQLLTGWALICHALLGVICALVGHFFIYVLHKSEHYFSHWRVHPVLKPAMGGLCVGVIGLWIPQVFGTGAEFLDLMFRTPIALGALAVWLAGKLVATSFTLGSGGSGGDLMPSLFLGAAAGGAWGNVAHHLFPHATMPPGAYALVGAASLFAGVAHAPVTAIILGFEMGRDYGIILPLMIACSISSLLSSRLRTSSLYTLKLEERGVDLQRMRSVRVDVMDAIRVADVMTRKAPAVPPDFPLPDLLNRFAATGHHGFLVSDKGRLAGIVTLADAQRALDGSEKAKVVRDIATKDPIVCYPSDTLNQALRRLGTREVGRIPVVSEEDPGKVVGLLRRSDILRGYSQALEGEKSAQDPAAASLISPARIQEGQVAEFPVHETDAFRNARVMDLRLPHGVVFVAIRRGRKTLVPSGSTVLRNGDRVTVFLAPEAIEPFQDWLRVAKRNGGAAPLSEEP
jgi:CIC family chloride channel protein